MLGKILGGVPSEDLQRALVTDLKGALAGREEALEAMKKARTRFAAARLLSAITYRARSHLARSLAAWMRTVALMAKDDTIHPLRKQLHASQALAESRTSAAVSAAKEQAQAKRDAAASAAQLDSMQKAAAVAERRLASERTRRETLEHAAEGSKQQQRGRQRQARPRQLAPSCC